jgi:hypothetical protein
MAAITNRTTSQIEAQIQMGDSTHHQLHVIFPINFKTTKQTVNSPVKPIPSLLLDSLMNTPVVSRRV